MMPPYNNQMLDSIVRLFKDYKDNNLSSETKAFINKMCEKEEDNLIAENTQQLMNDLKEIEF